MQPVHGVLLSKVGTQTQDREMEYLASMIPGIIQHSVVVTHFFFADVADPALLASGRFYVVQQYCGPPSLPRQMSKHARDKAKLLLLLLVGNLRNAR